MVGDSSLHEIWSGDICEALLVLKNIPYLMYKYCIFFKAPVIA